jgi:hypothetical protein
MTHGNANPSGMPAQSNIADLQDPAAGPDTIDLHDREMLFATHPVITRGFKIPTSPIRRAFEIMSQTIASGAPGCAFVAFPRFGKTYATQYCKEKLGEAFPNLPVIRFHAHHERATQRRFYADLLEQSGFGDVRHPPLKDLRQQLVRAWWVLAQSRDSGTIVLIGDEMQCLNADAYSWLIDLTNDLHELNVRAIAILFGQPELAALRAVLREMHRGDILGRFMSRVYSFDGITSASELQEVMRSYDDPSEFEYPASSGCSFTNFFLPQAFAHGWRLASCAGKCWEQFRLLATTRLSSPAKVQRLSVGMEWVAGALQYALAQYSDYDSVVFKISAEQWSAAIESSGFSDSLGLTYDPDWSRDP